MDSSQYSRRSQQMVVWIVSTHPLISKSSSLYTNPLVTVLRAPSTIGITVTFMFHRIFQFRSKVFIFLSAFFPFYSVVSRNNKVHNSVSSLFLSFQGLVVWPRLGDFYLIITENFVRFILQDWFWVVHISSVRMIRLQFLAQFPVDHFAHPVVSSLTLFLC